MRIEVDVLRAEQSYELNTGAATNYLVVNIFGSEVRVSCTEGQLALAIASAAAPRAATPHQEIDHGDDDQMSWSQQAADAPRPVVAGPTFAVQEDAPAARQRREIKSVRRPVADDEGIQQG